MKKIVFFDVETNNLRNDRICQLAMIYEEDGQEIFEKCWYIDPESPFAEQTIRIHGITQDMVKDSPSFPAIWKEIQPYFETSLIVGHNVNFDLTVLDKVFQYYDIQMDAVTYGDTISKAGQMAYGSYSYSLDSLCEAFNVVLDHHHDAMSDTRACRELYHIFDKCNPWSTADEHTYWFGKATLKADPNELDSALLDLDGILFGIISDGTVTSEELSAIENWSDSHSYQRKYPGFSEAYEVVNQILESGLIPDGAPEKIHRLSCGYGGKLYSRTTIALQTLKGIVNGIIADDVINEGELLSLRAWMSQNMELHGNYPFDTLFETIEKVMEDNTITSEEQEELLSIFRRFTDPIGLAQDMDVSIAGKTCCLSGNFVYGSKSTVEKKIIEMGGTIVPSVTKKTDVLIVGGQGSSAWAYGNYGNKVKKALQMQQSGHPIEILGETQVL
ncbi:MAG: hypothetical protein IKE28_12730 [Solobacterium sp.]|nr:hypothetical protein [Solobacterium sp.]